MDELTRVLWNYALEYCIDGCYDMQSQNIRQTSKRIADWNETELRKLCPTEAIKHLDGLLDEQGRIYGEDIDAAFVCGLRMGLSLR